MRATEVGGPCPAEQPPRQAWDGLELLHDVVYNYNVLG
jgi:hypothetical protein